MKRLRSVRKMTYVLWAWCLLILTWAIAGAASTAGDTAKCVHDSAGYLSHTDCANAVGAGATMGVGVVLFIGFFGFVFFSLIWFMTRPKHKAATA